MAGRPIFMATHPRSCSTAFERVFMTRRDDLACAHEPFGDAFYYGPERLSDRFADDEEARNRSGFANTTYKDVVDRLEEQGANMRLFVKDMAYYIVPPEGKPARTAPSLKPSTSPEVSPSSPSNPTVLPLAVLRRFHFVFLIRHPRRSVPSYYRCTVPPLVDATQFTNFMPSEAGYRELRQLFDFLREEGLVGDGVNSSSSSDSDSAGAASASRVRLTVIDADDLLDRPTEAVQAFCRHTGLTYTPDMLKWADEESQQHAREAFAKWAGFHNDALASSSLRPRTQHKKTPTEDEENEEWKAKFGEPAQKVIRDCVNANVPDYEYLKSFALDF